MVERGLGISLLPAWSVREEVQAGRLAQLQIAEHQLRRAVAMLALARFQPAPTRAFLAFMLRHRAQLQTLATSENVRELEEERSEVRGQ
jgi:DNA-binding transcriptional LysR family regulator